MKKRKSYKFKYENIDQVMEAAADYIASRIKPTKSKRFTQTEGVKNYYKHALAAKEREEFRVIFLQNNHALIAAEVMFKGTVNGCQVIPREVAKRALELNACAIIVGHNHPTGDVEPSTHDKFITKELVAALRLVDVRVLDHIIVGGDKALSFAEVGLI